MNAVRRLKTLIRTQDVSRVRISFQPIRLRIEIQEELVWVWPEPNGVQFLLSLEVQPRVDHVLCNDVTPG